MLRAALADRFAVERAAAVAAEVGASAGPLRSGATFALALTVAASAPDLPHTDLVTLGKLGAWICALDDTVDRGDIDDDTFDLHVSHYEGLVYGDFAFDPIARLFVDVLAALRRAPLGPTLWPRFSLQLCASLRAMRWEHAAMRAHGVSIEAYLAHARDSICVGFVVTAAAMLIGERAILDHIAQFLAAQRHGAMAVRLANDAASWDRERAEGVINIQRFGVGRADIDRMIATEIAAMEAELLGLPPRTSEFLVRLVGLMVAIYRRGDLDTVVM
jgi:hypothetical protein